jgi:hypothetical protein
MTTTEQKRLRKWFRKEIDFHLVEAEMLYDAGSFAAARWEDGYVAALKRMLTRLGLGTMKVKTRDLR